MERRDFRDRGYRDRGNRREFREERFGDRGDRENREEMREEKEDYDNNFREEKKREIVIPGETVATGSDFLPGDFTQREGNEIVATRFGLADISGRLVKIIPLAGVYMPRKGNIVIGKVTDITFNGWIIDINAPYNAFLPAAEANRFVNKNDLTEFLDFGDIVVAKVDSIKRRGIDLTTRAGGLGQLEEGMTIDINSNKVPRVIGKEGSMINLIKKETMCNIVVGQNGIIWIRGNDVKSELLAKEAILFIVNKSFVEGLTEKVEKFFAEKK
ncbi:RNA-binding protein [Candidatus Pacearchaeota archaeon]|nr:RNA-binding protein [Candidatus Pacearchaeota archaeon]